MSHILNNIALAFTFVLGLTIVITGITSDFEHTWVGWVLLGVWHGLLISRIQSKKEND